MSQGINGVDDSYRHLPVLYLSFLLIWSFSACSWTVNTFKNRHFQIFFAEWYFGFIVVTMYADDSNLICLTVKSSTFMKEETQFDFDYVFCLEQTNSLQWTLASVPLIKALQLTLSFLFWHSCFHHHICSLWMSFGVYVTGVLFQTASFVSFLLISHGYCITCERLSLTERRTTASLGCVFYLTLVGYRASVPYFAVLLILNYIISFYVIFHHISQNLSVLREQLSFIEDENVQAMHDAVYAKYIMFKKFQAAMQIVAMAETVIYMNMDNSSQNYWLRLLIREWAQFCIFLYIGWTFRSQDMAPRFSVMPTLKPKENTIIPPIYSMEMDAKSFKEFRSQEWNIGVPMPYSNYERRKDSVLVIIQHPR